MHRIIFEDVDAIASAKIDWDRFKNKTVLISGAYGFLAAYLVYTFLRINEKYHIECKVIGLGRSKDKAAKKFGILLERNDFEFVINDVSEPLAIKDKIDFIIHAASKASPKDYGSDPVGVINANVLGTNNLLELAKVNSVASFLYFSSGEVYGIVPAEKIPIKETDYGYIDITNVRACYSEGKRLGETMCVSWAYQHHIPAKIVRPFHTYGPGMDLNDGRVYADFISDIVNNRNIVMKSDGSAIRPFCYLKDATEGFLRVLVDGKNGEAYNIGNPAEEVSIIDLADKLAGLYPAKKLSVQRKEQSKQGYIQSPILRNSPNIEKAEGLGWHPSTSIETGFKRTIESYS